MAGQYIPSHGAALPSQYFPLLKQTRTISPGLQPPYSSKGQCWWGKMTVPLWWGAHGPCQHGKGAFGIGFPRSWTPKKKLEAMQWLLNCDGAGALKTAETFTIALTGLHLTPATRSSPCAILSNKHTCKEQTLPSGCAQERCQPCYALSNLLNNGIILALRADILWIN